MSEAVSRLNGNTRPGLEPGRAVLNPFRCDMHWDEFTYSNAIGDCRARFTCKLNTSGRE